MKKEENLKQKGTQFWKQVSTGLRSPLNVIRGTAGIAQNEIYDVESVREGFRKIEESSEFLLGVVNDIVDFVTIQNNDLKIQEEPFNLNELVKRFTAKYYYKSVNQNKHLNAQIHGVIHERLIGDEHRVEQILECMLNNSLKYTTERDKIYFRIYETGMSEDKVFMRFTLTGTNRRIYDTLNETINGRVVTEATDLEIHNGYYFLMSMGGNIELVLDEDENSEIIIDMAFGLEESQEEAGDNSFFDNEHILIVCDSREEAEERGQLLAEMNVAYETAVDSEEALEMIGAAEEKKIPYSACVVDWNIENFELQEFVNDVHNIFGREMPLIAMAYNVETVRAQAARMGFNHVMEHTWFRSTICDVLMKNTEGIWKQLDSETDKKYDFSGRHIMVAEDAPLNREFIVRILNSVHADVTCVANGIEACNTFKVKPEGYFDCILMDIDMPEMNGYEATGIIRETDRADARRIPIFALTANAFQSDIRKALETGMDGHFSKPVDIERMYSTMELVFSEVEEGIYNNDVQEETHRDKKEDSNEHHDKDPVTGLLSMDGLEQRVSTQKYLAHPTGYLFIEVNKFDEIKEQHGHVAADSLLRNVAERLKEKFRSSDLLVRHSDSSFAVVLNNCTSGIGFVEGKIQAINTELTDVENEVVSSISVGAAFSLRGYSPKLAGLAYEALNLVKHSQKYGCCILDEKTGKEEEEALRLLESRMTGLDMFYLRGENVADIESADELMTMILGRNQAVGIMCGTYDEGLPVCSASGFALSNLGYDADSFMAEANGMFDNLVFEEDLSNLHRRASEYEMEVRKLRLKHRNGSILWFNAAYVNIIAPDGKKMWIASLRPFDDNVVGKLCDLDYATVSVIIPEENMIIIEKGNEVVYNKELRLRKKYDYDSLNKNVFVNLHKESEKDEYLHNTSIDNLVKQLDQKGIYEFILYQKREDGSSIPVRFKYRYLDETRREILLTREYVENLAESDDVTSFLNERGFYRNVKNILTRKENAGKEYAILYSNIKDFKSCNEVLGYANGNVLLRKYAELIEKSGLKPVCCARFYADEFCFLVEKENLDYGEINSICHKKFEIMGNVLNVRLHCGIYLIEDVDQDVSSMCDRAVLAADNITNEYARPYYVFDERVNERYYNRMFVLNNLERALSRDEFQVYYQPVCDAKTGEIRSAEALVRWIMPGGKIVSPGVFIPVLENKGYISRLDLLVAGKVQKFIESRSAAGYKTVPVSANLSRMDFMNETFISDLTEQIAGTTTDKALLRYEVTESAFTNVGESGKSLLEELRKNGSQIYVDDFGTGYSSLQNLMEIDFDVLKLDMHFIRKIGQSAVSEGIIESAINICHRLDRKVIAEGVETVEQVDFLREKGCDFIQGYYFYKPVPEREFAELLDEGREV